MNSERTQITRKTTSAPMRWIVDNVDIPKFGDVLHFGEGKAFEDTAALERSGSRVFAYDPGSPDIVKHDLDIIDPACGLYAVGVSVYVFNTLLPLDRQNALRDMLGCCQRCVIAVRTDKVAGEAWQDGVITSRNTFQTQLNAEQWQAWFLAASPEWASVSILHKTSAYVILDIKRKRRVMKQYTKPSVREGLWYTRAECRVDGHSYRINVQVIDGTYQDHYAIWVDGKRQRKTYFGEMAHWDVARAYNDLVGWQNAVFGDEL